LGKYPESRFPPKSSENFGKISGKPLPAGIVRKFWENIRKAASRRNVPNIVDTHNFFNVQSEKRIINDLFFTRENILKAASRPNFANIVGLS
jgi:hypothetical protein